MKKRTIIVSFCLFAFAIDAHDTSLAIESAHIINQNHCMRFKKEIIDIPQNVKKLTINSCNLLSYNELIVRAPHKLDLITVNSNTIIGLNRIIIESSYIPVIKQKGNNYCGYSSFQVKQPTYLHIIQENRLKLFQCLLSSTIVLAILYSLYLKSI